MSIPDDVARIIKGSRGKIMTVEDMRRLKGDPPAPLSTHLFRYEDANDTGVAHVLNVDCPDCGSKAGKPCA